MRETWVVGAASNRYGKMPETGREAATRVALEALDSAGLDPREIGYTFVSNCFGVAERQAHVGPLINTGLGIPEVPSCTIESACSSSSAGLHEAFVHVAGGFADAALVVGVEKLSHLDTLARDVATSRWVRTTRSRPGTAPPFPDSTRLSPTPTSTASALAREQLGAVAVKNHANGAHNPHAQFQKAITLETYLRSPVIASPLRLYDCCPFSDGAAAVVVAARETRPVARGGAPGHPGIAPGRARSPTCRTVRR